MYTKEDIEKAKQYLDNEGYGTGSNFTLNMVANLMAEYAAKNCVIPVVSGSVFRCGFCGTPTDKDGNPMSLDYCNSLTDEQLNSAELVHGYCCYEEQQDNYITVTRDMAIDAQDMSLEGQQWRW